MSSPRTYSSRHIENLDAIHEWLRQANTHTLFALVTEKNASQIIVTLQAIATKLDIKIVGAVFPELIFSNNFQSEGFILVAYSEELPFYICEDIGHSENCIEDTIAPLAKLCDYYESDAAFTFFLVFDALVPNIASLLDALYLKIGDRVNYAGVNAGSETFQPMDCLFDNTRSVQNAALALCLPSSKPAVLEHGYRAPSQMISATAAEGNRITSIDWRPAFDVYAEQVKKHYDIEITKENFYENAVHFPFGIMRMDSQILVRIPVALQDDGSLFCVGEVPEQSLLTLLEAESVDSKNAVISLVENSLKQNSDHQLFFYCAGRRMHKKDSALKELYAIDEMLPNQDVIGALSLGEIGNSYQEGYPLFHNATLVSLPMA